MTYEFDHLVITADTLENGVAWAEEHLGVPLQDGGKHARYGTHNALLGLADGLYLEVIAVDPEAEPPSGPRLFGLDTFNGPPRLETWVCRASGLADLALPKGFERVVLLTRGTLSWDMAEATGGMLPFGQCHPGLIDWGTTPHPAASLSSSGLKLLNLTLAHPDVTGLKAALEPLEDARVCIEKADVPLVSAEFETADGRKITL
jgi:Glyoxalase-like domain